MYQDWFEEFNKVKDEGKIKMCKCCEQIEFIKELNKSTKIPNVKRELKASITSISKRKGIRGIVGRIDYKSYDLNYCPMCGRRLEE